MPAVVDDNYSIASGASLWAGRDAPRPAWRTDMTARTWRVIPAASQLAALDPKANAAINPVHPSTPEWAGSGFGQLRMFNAWCGGCYDQANDVFWAPLQGGHTDYGGNEPYKIALNAAAPEWVMVRNPSGAVGNTLTTKDSQEASGVYSDGQPRAVHSYNKPVYVPGDGPWLGVAGAAWFSGSDGLLAPLRVDPVTGNGTYGATITTTPPSVAATSGGGACYDSSRHCIWFRVAGTGYIFKYDLAGDSWSREGSSLAGGSYAGLCYVAAQDLIAYLDGNGTGTFRIYDPTAGTYSAPAVSGSTTGAGITGQAQPWWIASLGVIAWWDNSTATTSISTLTPPVGDWKSGTWTLGSLSVNGANAVTPTARNSNGTYGRFAYSPNLGGFFLLNSAEQDAYFFALD